VLCGERINMRGDQLARQWRVIRAIEASPNGLTVAEVAQREETGIRTIYRDLEALQAAGFPLYTEKVERATKWAFIDTFKFKIPPFISRKAAECAKQSENLVLYSMSFIAVKLMKEFRGFIFGIETHRGEPNFQIERPGPTTGLKQKF
jgi:hypothetical protein